MFSKSKKSINFSRIYDGARFKYLIVASKFNEDLVNHLLTSCKQTLLNNYAKEKDIHVVRCPGAGEIPFSINRGIHRIKPDVVIALAVIVKGETPHYDIISYSVSHALQKIAIELDRPVINGIITTYNINQAKQRVLANKLNKGHEFALSAIETAGIY